RPENRFVRDRHTGEVHRSGALLLGAPFAPGGVLLALVPLRPPAPAPAGGRRSGSFEPRVHGAPRSGDRSVSGWLRTRHLARRADHYRRRNAVGLVLSPQ